MPTIAQKIVDEVKSVAAQLESYAASFPQRLSQIEGEIESGGDSAVKFYRTYSPNVRELCETAELFGVAQPAAEACLSALTTGDDLAARWEQRHHRAATPLRGAIPAPSGMSPADVQKAIDRAVAQALAAFTAQLARPTPAAGTPAVTP